MSRQLRKKPRISYAELDEPSPDEYVFCTQCGDYVYEYCCVHGALLVVPDDKVPSKSPYPPVVPRAALTIPHVFLHIAPSIIPGAGLGVFATLTLPCGVRFGPYRGRKTTDLTSWYSWQIYDRNGKPSHVVDADDPNNSNWMRYVNCSRHSCEQNLVAYQYRGELYYRTIKIIPRFTELMVFYGGEFAHLLHIDIRAYNRPLLYTQRHGRGAPSKKTSKVTGKTPPTASSAEINEPKLSRAARGDCDTNKENRQKLESEEPKAKILKKSTNKKYTPPIKKTNESLNISNIPHNNRNIENSNSTDKQDISPEPVAKVAKYAQPTLKNDENTVANKLQDQVKQFNVVRENFLQNDLLCDICNYKTNKKKSLECHLILHTQDKNILKCSCCGYMTKQKSNLMAHMRTHTGEKPFTCEVCNYKFTESGHMKSHMRTHTGEKPFTCEVCDYKFTTSGNMTTHMRIHTGEKPYTCKVCNYKCTQSGPMKRHMRTHTGEKQNMNDTNAH